MSYWEFCLDDIISPCSFILGRAFHRPSKPPFSWFGWVIVWVWAIARTLCQGLLQLDVTGGFTVHPLNCSTRFSGSVVGYLCQISIPVLAPVNIYLDALKYFVSVSFICNKIPPFLGNRKKKNSHRQGTFKVFSGLLHFCTP